MRSAAAAGRADRRRLRLTLDLPAATAATGRGAGSQHQIYWVCPPMNTNVSYFTLHRPVCVGPSPSTRARCPSSAASCVSSSASPTLVRLDAQTAPFQCVSCATNQQLG